MERLFDAHTPNWDAGLYKICTLLARLLLAYLFFTQLFWKLPPRFGCGTSFAFPKPAAENYWDSNGSSGLCYWMGLESVFASQPRKVLVADMRSAHLPSVGVNITPVAEINGWLLDNLFIPQIRVFGWLVFLFEFITFFSLAFGLFSRVGALAAIGIIGQLYIGLANVPRPFEWEWTYGAILALSIIMLGAASGRFFGLDAWLRPKLAGAAKRGSRLARIGLLLG
ncbi:MAG TPA: hypothetical protein VLL49_04575 [Anaerolineales bacterium]|nr:hypothetical protein [Anaerolineales bacterium]